MGTVGCELIATYNAMLALGSPVPLGYIADYYDDHAMVLDGHWGTHPAAIPEYFKRQGYTVSTLYNSDVYSYSEFDMLFDSSTVVIMSYWNNPDSVAGALHTVMIVRTEDGKILVYNYWRDGDEPFSECTSIAEFIEKENILPVMLTGIR